MIPVTFKAKARPVFNMDGSEAYRYVPVPTLTRAHVDMRAARAARVLGAYANSDMFPNIVNRQARALLGVGPHSLGLRLDRIPEGVDVDTSGFLAVVRLSIPDSLRLP